MRGAKTSTSEQLAKEIEWLRGPPSVRTLAPDAWTSIANRVEKVLQNPALSELLDILDRHNRNEKRPFLLGPYVFQIIQSVEERWAMRRKVPSLNQPPALVRARFETASRKSKELADLLRKGHQPSVALAGHRRERDAWRLVTPFPIIQGQGKSAVVISLDCLLERAAELLNSVAEKITRAKQHGRPAKMASNAQKEELRSRAVSVLTKVFLERLNQPYHRHVASVAELLSGLCTDADYVKKVAKRSARSVAGDKTAQNSR
jgi:hypothetical protein